MWVSSHWLIARLIWRVMAIFIRYSSLSGG
jgi:hypothetical protein